MLNKGDIVILKYEYSPNIFKIMDFTFSNMFNANYVYAKPINSETLCCLPLDCLELYKPYYRLKKLKKLMENV